MSAASGSADPATDPVADSSAEEAAKARRRRTEQELRDRLERATGIAQREVVIADARGIRALAHEARQQVIDALFNDYRTFTATELAEKTGLTPSAMSYHLRALEKWGVVERAEESGDGRNRPWRAAGTSLRLLGDNTATQTLRSQAFDAVERRVRQLRTLPPEERARYIAMSTSVHWMNDEETEYLAMAVQRALVELAERGWRDEATDDRARVGFFWSILPEPPLAGADAEQAAADETG